MKVAASPRVCMGRCPKISRQQVSCLEFPHNDRRVANEKDFSLLSK